MFPYSLDPAQIQMITFHQVINKLLVVHLKSFLSCRQGRQKASLAKPSFELSSLVMDVFNISRFKRNLQSG